MTEAAVGLWSPSATPTKLADLTPSEASMLQAFVECAGVFRGPDVVYAVLAQRYRALWYGKRNQVSAVKASLKKKLKGGKRDAVVKLCKAKGVSI